MALRVEVREDAKATLREYFPIGADVAALTVGYRRRTAGSSVYTVALLANVAGCITNVSEIVAKGIGANLTKERNAVSFQGYPAELVGWLARELYGSSTTLNFRKV